MSKESARKVLDEQDRIISLNEAGEILRILYSTAMRLEKRGELKVFRI